MPALPPLILLLCENEAAANIDRRALREAGYPNPQVMTSGADAARLLAGQEDVPPEMIPDIVICHRQMADMSGLQFCAIIRQHPRLSLLPLVLILPNNSEAEHLKTIDSGVNAVLARPFSVDTLKAALDRLAQVVPLYRKQWLELANANSDAFEGAVITQGILLRSEKTPEEFFRLGIKLLGESNWKLAIAAFEKALRDPGIRAEVEMGLAAANRGKGDAAEFRKWLARACDTFVAEKRWTRARSAYAKLLQIDSVAKNPFLTEAHRMIRQHEYAEAAEALVQGHNLVPKMKIAERYASVCMTASDPQAMYGALEAELDREGELAFLRGEIRASLDLQLQQREARQKEMAAERAFKLAKNMGWQVEEDQAPEEIVIPAPEDAPLDIKPEWQQNSGTPQPKPMPRRRKKEAVPEPLPTVAEFETSAQPEDDLFQGRSTFSDLMSMIRLTWRLNKKSKK